MLVATNLICACSNVLVGQRLFKCDDGSKTIFLSTIDDYVFYCLDGSDERYAGICRLYTHDLNSFETIKYYLNIKSKKT